MRLLLSTLRIPIYALGAALVAVGLLWWVLILVPAPSIRLEVSQESQALYDREGKLLFLSLSSDERYRLPTPLRDISREAQRATLTYEDQHFYSHPGINPFALARAVSSIFLLKRKVGGSTLTMQLARVRLGLDTKSLIGKLQQCFWALVLERHYTKEELLEAYFNYAPYGANVEGIGAASLIYFNKPARDLTLEESVSLAVLPQHPSLRWRKKGEQSLIRAREILISRLASRSPIVAKNFISSPAEVPQRAPHLFQRLHAKLPGKTEYRSTLDAPLQAELEQILRDSLERFSDRGVKNGALILAELPDLSVRAYIGSAEYLNGEISGFVNGLSAERSPGSLLKPLLYALAVDQGVIIPATTLFDLPLRLASYKPENFERNFIGPISAADALVRSRNVPALQLFRALPQGKFYQLLRELGIQRLKSPEFYGIALVLGGLGTTAEEIVQSYGALANSGTVKPLRFLSGEAAGETTQVFSKEASYLVQEMLARNPPALAGFKDLEIPWKTGTSYGAKDAWAAGIVGKYVLAVWVGNFNSAPNPNFIGRDIAGPVFFSVVDSLKHRGLSTLRQSPAGLNLKKVELCPLSGALPGPDCPHRKEGWFIPGVSPISPCPLHKRVRIHRITGLRTCAPDEEGEDKVFEMWDSAAQDLFQRIGLKRNVPPDIDPACSMSAQERAIRIISPEEHLEYMMENHRDLEVELLASVPADSSTVRWFIDDIPLGETSPTVPLYWKATPGTFVVRAVDLRGRSATLKLRVTPAPYSG